MRVTVIAVVFCALGTVSKGLKGDGKNWKSEEESRPSIVLLRSVGKALQS